MPTSRHMSIDAGKAAGDGDQVGSVLYSRGIYAAMVICRGGAQGAGTGRAPRRSTPPQMRDGFEALEITEARMVELGLPNFGQPFAASCADHGGPGAGLMQQWDASAKKWNLITGFIAPDRCGARRRWSPRTPRPLPPRTGIAERCN